MSRLGNPVGPPSPRPPDNLTPPACTTISITSTAGPASASPFGRFLALGQPGLNVGRPGPPRRPGNGHQVAHQTGTGSDDRRWLNRTAPHFGHAPRPG